MAEYRVVKIGWQNTNGRLNIALVSKRDRVEIGCDLNGGVSVKKDARREIALVQMQFREFVGQERVATLNKKLADALGVTVGDTIEIDNGVTETEWAAFMQAIPQVEMPPFARLIAGMVAAQRRRDPQPVANAQDECGHE